MAELSRGVRGILIAVIAALIVAMAVLPVLLTGDRSPRETEAESLHVAPAPKDGQVADSGIDSQPQPPVPDAAPLPPSSDEAPPQEDLRPEPEDLDRLDVRLRNDYPPGAAEPRATVEYLFGGGLRVSVHSPGVNSMNAAYGLAVARRVVRSTGLSDAQLARVQRVEKAFLAAVDRQMADLYDPIETTAQSLAEAIAAKRWSDFRRGVDQLDRQMSAVNDRWVTLYEEYLGELEPILTPEQLAQARQQIVPSRPAPGGAQ
jgi:hypothetical protein